MTETDFDAFTPPSRPVKRRVSRVLIAMVLIALAGVVVAGFGFFGFAQYRAYDLTADNTEAGVLKGAETVIAKAVDASEIHRGDLVMLDFGAFPDAAGEHGAILKRVIGVGGDTVNCCDPQGRMQVNGKPVNETYLHGPKPERGDIFAPYFVKVPAGSFFVVGDNRDNSRDSRSYFDLPGFGAVPASSVYGVAVATGDRLAPQPLTPTTAFTDAGLPGAATPGEDMLLQKILVVAALVLVLGGIVGMFVSLIRSGGRAQPRDVDIS